MPHYYATFLLPAPDVARYEFDSANDQDALAFTQSIAARLGYPWQGLYLGFAVDAWHSADGWAYRRIAGESEVGRASWAYTHLPTMLRQWAPTTSSAPPRFASPPFPASRPANRRLQRANGFNL